MKIVIPGGSGQIGTILARHFHQQGHTVTVLSRAPKAAPWQVIRWDAQTVGPWTAALEQSDVCINLTGRSVNCRYHTANRRQMYDSRIVSTRLLNDVIASLTHPPRLWLNASTATIYRHAFDRPMDEMTGELGGNEPGAPDTWNFSIRIAKDWEAAFFAGQTRSTRKIAMRSSITFIAGKGGVFDVLSRLVRCGLGGAQGSGTQYVSWIHEADFVRAVDFLINQAAPFHGDQLRFIYKLTHAPSGLLLQLVGLLLTTIETGVSCCHPTESVSKPSRSSPYLLRNVSRNRRTESSAGVT